MACLRNKISYSLFRGGKMCQIVEGPKWVCLLICKKSGGAKAPLALTVLSPPAVETFPSKMYATKKKQVHQISDRILDYFEQIFSLCLKHKNIIEKMQFCFLYDRKNSFYLSLQSLCQKPTCRHHKSVRSAFVWPSKEFQAQVKGFIC